MSAAVSANLMGITGIARRLVLDGAMDEASARKAMEAATGERVPLATFIADRKLVQPAALAAAAARPLLARPLAADPAPLRDFLFALADRIRS